MASDPKPAPKPEPKPAPTSDTKPASKPAPQAEAKPRTATEQIPGQAGGISALASANAPFIYFDGSPNFGTHDGVLNISLEAIRYTPVDGDIMTDRVVVAHLRMGMKAAQSLKLALEKVILLATPVGSAERN